MATEAARRRPIDLVLVVAVAENGVIGRDNKLPWRLKSDMRHFRTLTMGKPVVMGRKTFQSIPKLLKGRTSIVVSRDISFAAPGIVVARTLDAALLAARGDALRRAASEIMVVGGQDIFDHTLPIADRLEVTLVHARPDGHRFFPAIDPKTWREIERKDFPSGPDDESAFSFATYRRAAADQ